jgi:F-type H+-transporting ATPase subunit c
MDVLLAIVPPAIDAMRMIAQEGEGGQTTFAITDDGMKFIGAGIAMGLGGLGPALAIGTLAGRALDALGRNPEAQPVVQTNMILGLAFAEAIAIYALVTAIMIGFVF